MEFRTVVDIPDSGFRIGPCESMLFVGSCFADSIGRRFQEEKFRAVVNPFGVMYNPASILHTIERIVKQGDGSFVTSAGVTKEPSPCYPYPYLYNISNRLSQQFYGAQQLTAYELKGGSGPIMQCRHCIRYALGYCVKHGGKRPIWREPLSLVLGDGRRFRLEFDCQHCQMNVYAS